MKTRRRLNDSTSPLKSVHVELNRKVIAFLVLNCCIFWGQTILFCISRPRKWLVILASLLLVAFFSLVASSMLRWVASAGVVLGKRCNRILSCFLLFFLTVVGYLVLVNLAVSLPIGWIMACMGFSHDAINIYSLQTSNCAFALAVLTWLRFLPGLLRNVSGLATSA